MAGLVILDLLEDLEYTTILSFCTCLCLPVIVYYGWTDSELRQDCHKVSVCYILSLVLIPDTHSCQSGSTCNWPPAQGIWHNIFLAAMVGNVNAIICEEL